MTWRLTDGTSASLPTESCLLRLYVAEPVAPEFHSLTGERGLDATEGDVVGRFYAETSTFVVTVVSTEYSECAPSTVAVSLLVPGVFYEVVSEKPSGELYRAALK
jgi:hypothetical protein